jgi:hypothetical protein
MPFQVFCKPTHTSCGHCNTAAERNPPIEEVIKTGAIPRFVEFLQRGDAPQLQVCWGRASSSTSYSTPLA